MVCLPRRLTAPLTLWKQDLEELPATPGEQAGFSGTLLTLVPPLSAQRAAEISQMLNQVDSSSYPDITMKPTMALTSS